MNNPDFNCRVLRSKTEKSWLPVWQLAIISLISVNQVAFKAVFQLQNVIRRDLLKENWVKSLRLYDLQITLASKQDLILPTPLSSFKSYVRSKNWAEWRKTLNAAWWCNVARRRVRHNVRITTSPIPNWAELNKSDLWTTSLLVLTPTQTSVRLQLNSMGKGAISYLTVTFRTILTCWAHWAGPGPASSEHMEVE